MPVSPTSRPPARPAGPLRVLVVDDSDASQRALADLLHGAPEVEVLGRAGDGEEALRLCLQLEPDCVFLDLEMPRMDGFTFLRLLMTRRPTAVVVVSARSRKQDVFKALELGALDFLPKPEAPDGARDPAPARDELLAKLALVRALRLPPRAPTGAPPAVAAAREPLRHGVGRPARVAVIGASTGGPAALTRLLAALPAGLPLGLAVAQHMPERFTRAFAQRLARTTGLDAREAEEGDELTLGRVLVAPGGKHLRLVRGNGPLAPLRAALASPDPQDGRRYCPSVDALFESAAEAMGERVCAVVLTGMGNDGCAGVERVKAAGGLVLAESEQTAVVYGMPREAADSGKVDEVLSLEEIVARLCRFAEGRRA